MKNKEKKKKGPKKDPDEKFRKRRDSLSDAPVTSSGGSEQSSADGQNLESVEDEGWGVELPTVSGIVQSLPTLSDERRLAYNTLLNDEITALQNMNSFLADHDANVFWSNMIGGLLLNGDYIRFVSLCRCLMMPLRSARPDLYNDKNERQMMEYIIPRIANLTYDSDLKRSAFSMLTMSKVPCQARDHGFCKLTALIGDYCDPKSLQNLLYLRDHEENRTALYMAAKNRQPCLVHTLLELGADPNARSSRGRTPAYEALKSDNYQVLNELSIYGADLNRTSYNPEDFGFFEPKISFDIPYVKTWHSRRIETLEKKFREYVSQATHDSITLKPGSQISSLHVFPLTRNQEHAFIDDAKTQTLRSIDLEMKKLQGMKNPVLIFIPFSYPHQILDGAADSIVTQRIALLNSKNKVLEVIYSNPILSTETGICDLPSAVDGPMHNGHIYVFQLPQTLIRHEEELKTNPRFFVNLILELQGLTKPELRYIHFMMQAYDLNPDALDTKKNV
ncbi:unnamed protein product [Bursaphelenchus xylophilus]|uniref:(pine wood nematode) hypothetical protein n=1 Tax=Bursaphelenchus xylophilus TaxID=6326 RepID=A0A1I7RWY1_BURXY|nr:unnamed protein product [Bursaphelenchus xylophilus]CAG9121195.1 unnamed protein product [Bursaphelenchus xylophilus]